MIRSSPCIVRIKVARSAAEDSGMYIHIILVCIIYIDTYLSLCIYVHGSRIHEETEMKRYAQKSIYVFIHVFTRMSGPPGLASWRTLRRHRGRVDTRSRCKAVHERDKLEHMSVIPLGASTAKADP